jgi:hypothetical protein
MHKDFINELIFKTCKDPSNKNKTNDELIVEIIAILHDQFEINVDPFVIEQRLNNVINANK